MMIACVLIPRFSLRVACSGSIEGAVALAPLPGGKRAVGEVSEAAEAAGVAAGMELGEALARCPALRLVPADPAREAELWDGLLARLEGVGAAVESARPGEAFFAVNGLLRLHGGKVEGVLAAARRAAGVQVRIAVAPHRFAAFLAATRGVRLPRGLRGERAEAVVPSNGLRKFLAPQPVGVLSGRLDATAVQERELFEALERLGLDALGKLATLSPDQAADRFGALGLRALALARGEDTPLRPRCPREELVTELELPEGTAGERLDRALELLVGRLLASPKLRGRTVLGLRLTALLESGGSWSAEQFLSRPSASARTLRALLSPRLEALPAPASALRLRALALGPEEGEQLALAVGGRERRGRLAAAAREIRSAAGPEALLQVIEVDPRSRVPERRALLAPWRAR